MFQWNMESCPLLWNDASEEESVNGNHRNRWGEMFVILKHKLLQRSVHNQLGRKKDNMKKLIQQNSVISGLNGVV